MALENAKWIACAEELSAPVVVKKFNLPPFTHAEISVCGLGYYELFCNGKRVGEEFFKPAASDYCERDFSNYLYPLPDKTSHTVYYNRYDLTQYLREGENKLALLLGNGFFRQTRRDIEGKVHFSDCLIACFDLCVAAAGGDLHIVTDGTERAVRGFIAENNLFYGEVQDFALLGDQTEFAVRTVEPPCERMIEQTCPNDTIARTLTPSLVWERGNKRLYDAGENVAGFVVLTAAGEDIAVRHAETLNGAGELDFFSAGSKDQISETKYLNAPAGALLHPWFCWSGFRYFEVEGRAQNVRVAVVHSNIQITSEFSCENETVQWLYDAYLRTQLNNMHGGVPSDCPHRERLGYTGDGHLTAEAAMLLFDSRAFYEKWTGDIADCQDIESGHVQHTAPFMGGGGGPGGWGGAIALVPYYHYKTYRDRSFVRKYFPNIARYLACMRGFCENGLVVKERDKGWCLGDWCTPDPVALPEPFVNTFYYIACMRVAAYLAEEIGVAADYDKEIATCERALVQNYFDEKTGSFCGGVQGADAFALALGLGDERTKRNLFSKYEKLSRFDTGIFGTDVLCSYLVKAGRADLLFKLLSAREFPSFGYMKDNGATTLWEDWNGKSSHDHPMFGGCVKQIFFGLLGISGDCGYRNVKIDPPYLPALGKVHAKLTIGEGTLELDLRSRNGVTEISVRADKINVTLSGERAVRTEKELGE